MLVLLKKTPSMGTVHLFSHVASLIGRTVVDFAAKKRHTDKYCQTLDTWTHLIALLFCHMADCQSLRDICKGLQGIRGGPRYSKGSIPQCAQPLERKARCHGVPGHLPTASQAVGTANLHLPLPGGYQGISYHAA